MILRVRAICAAAALAVMAIAARGDVVHLKDGGQIEGKVVAEDKSSVTLETPLGRQTIDRARIDRVEKKLSLKEELAAREAALKDETKPDPWFEFANWAGSKGLKKERERLLDKVLALDPDHEGANIAKGRVKHAGRWMLPAERDQLMKEQEAAEMRAKGLVEFDGRWVTPYEKEHLDLGEELVDGKWLSADDAKRARGLVPLFGDWIPASEETPLRRARGFAIESKIALEPSRGDHVVAATSFGKDATKSLRDACEKAFGIAAPALHESTSDLTWIGGQKLLAVVVKSREDFARFARFFAHDEPKVDDRWADGVAKADGFFWWDPTGSSATFRGSRGDTATTAHTVHHLGHVLLNRHHYNFRFLPTWLDEGFAAWLEHATLGKNQISCIAARRYANDELRKEELFARADWFTDMEKQIAEQRDPPFFPILQRDLSDITLDEAAKAMVVVDHLIRRRPDDFEKFLVALRQAWPKGIVQPASQEVRAAHQKAFAALGTPAEQIDTELRAALAAAPKKK